MNLRFKLFSLCFIGLLAVLSANECVAASKSIISKDHLLAGVADNHQMWKGKVELIPGIEFKAEALKEPRMMKAYIATVDLRAKGLAFTGTERSKLWGSVMPDYTNRTVIIDTKRETTSGFMMRQRSAGKKVVLAVNTSPWGPWDCSAAYRSIYGNLGRWNVVDGVEISHSKSSLKGAFFVVYKNGKVDITSSVPRARTNQVALAMSGFGMIMKNGALTPYAKSSKDPQPRTVVGVDAKRTKLVFLVVDGRQKNYSLGASYEDLCNIMRKEGVVDAINMDGGGSASLVVFDESENKPWMLNHHKNFVERRNAMNLGIYFKDK